MSQARLVGWAVWSAAAAVDDDTVASESGAAVVGNVGVPDENAVAFGVVLMLPAAAELLS
jgi:hypothetical protein